MFNLYRSVRRIGQACLLAATLSLGVISAPAAAQTYPINDRHAARVGSWEARPMNMEYNRSGNTVKVWIRLKNVGKGPTLFARNSFLFALYGRSMDEPYLPSSVTGAVQFGWNSFIKPGQEIEVVANFPVTGAAQKEIRALQITDSPGGDYKNNYQRKGGIRSISAPK
jgi:hypothetical protein